MRKFLALFALLLPVLGHAATATINWTSITTAFDGTTLPAAGVVTSYQVWVGTSPISSTTTATPTATVTGTATTTTQTLTANPGQTIYARVKACNAGGCSDFSAESSAAVPIPVPGVPTSVTIKINFAP